MNSLAVNRVMMGRRLPTFSIHPEHRPFPNPEFQIHAVNLVKLVTGWAGKSTTSENSLSRDDRVTPIIQLYLSTGITHRYLEETPSN